MTAVAHWRAIKKLFLTPKVNPNFSTNSLLAVMHLVQTSKSSKQEFARRWVDLQILFIPDKCHVCIGFDEFFWHHFRGLECLIV